MAEASDTLGILYQNLLDAGCCEQTVKICMDFAKNGEWNRITAQMADCKKTLLRQVHTSQKQIDCLDFLVYEIEKRTKQEDL